MKLSLVVMTPGKSEGKAIPITLSQFLIGRDPQCHLRPASASISKRHCAILVKGGKVFVRDFDSTNGTFVNDQPVKGEVEVRHEDQLKLGPLLFGVRIEAKAARSASTPPSKPTPPPPTKPKPEAVDEESVGSWLLSLQDEDGPTSGEDPEVPEGSTVLEGAPPEQDPAAAPAPADKDKPPSKMEGNTSDAAKAILQKYMRRPRG